MPTKSTIPVKSAKPWRHLLLKQDKVVLASVEKLLAETVELRTQSDDADLQRREKRLKEVQVIMKEVDDYFEKSIQGLYDLQDKIANVVEGA